MRLAITAMVRDEADVIRQWVEYHQAQGVDLIIVTDNGSTDGTSEILAEFEQAGVLHLRHDPVHRKQQGEVVTAMAREAASSFGADWVVNADADEFLMPVDRSLRLHDVFAQLDPHLASFTVPVVNLVGPIADRGAGIDRLVWRDERSNDDLRTVGVLAQPSRNAIHVGDASVTVAQGNHVVSIASQGSPPDELALEVLHLPWRSWRQFEHKVALAGAGYEANPDLTPSANHHGMRDYARLRAGTLLAFYAARHVTSDEAVDGPFHADRSLVTFLQEHGITAPDDDRVIDESHARGLAAAGRELIAREADVSQTREELGRVESALTELQGEHTTLAADNERLSAELTRLGAELRALRDRKVVKAVDAVADRLRRH